MTYAKYVHSEQMHNLKAPRQIVPILMKSVSPRNVLDVGCGTGTWLKVFEENGIDDYLGIDGDSVSLDQLHIPTTKFQQKDISKHIDLGRKFDLVICLEVAEHLPEASADTLVSTLTRHADKILFSAAIPHQGGQHHINEQWPAYWQRKFETQDFFFHDPIRPLIWNDENVEWWYRQNIFLLTRERVNPDSGSIMPLVHPDLYKLMIKNNFQYNESLAEGRQGLKLSTRIFINAILFKIKTWMGFK